jgi:hypothetical protein
LLPKNESQSRSVGRAVPTLNKTRSFAYSAIGGQSIAEITAPELSEG